jgi:hypothetical protein
LVHAHRISAEKVESLENDKAALLQKLEAEEVLKVSSEIIQTTRDSKISAPEIEVQSQNTYVFPLIKKFLEMENGPSLDLSSSINFAALIAEKREIEIKLSVLESEYALLEDVSAIEIAKLEDAVQRTSIPDSDFNCMREELQFVKDDRNGLKIELQQIENSFRSLENKLNDTFLAHNQEKGQMLLEIESLHVELLRLNKIIENKSKMNGNFVNESIIIRSTSE